MKDITYAVLYSLEIPVQSIEIKMFNTMYEASEHAEWILNDVNGRIYGIIKCDITPE